MKKNFSSFMVSRPVLLITGILLIATSLRAPVTGIAPLLTMIHKTFALTTFATGTLTTLPLLAFAFASPFCVLLARHYGLERSLMLGLVLITSGIFIRSSGTVSMLFAGSAVIGLGIAIANVLLPALLKRDFPKNITTLTAVYAFVSGVAAAVFSGCVVPLATLPSSNWMRALELFAILPLLTIAVWLPQLRNHTQPVAETAAPQTFHTKIWQSSLAWYVTLFLGLNSLIYYTVITWLPNILTAAGYSLQEAGSLHGLTQLATAIPGLVLVPTLHRFKNHKVMAAGTTIITGIALLGLLCWPHHATIWTTLFGFGTGASFIMALSFISLRAGTVRQASALSGMAQTIGYTIAAAAPPLVGALHDTSGSWSAPIALCITTCGIMAVCGYAAGSSRQL